MGQNAKEVHERYLKCFNELYSESKRMGTVKQVSQYASIHGISSNISANMVKAGVLKKMSRRGTYEWMAGEPDEALVIKVLKVQNDYWRELKNKNPKKPDIKLVTIPLSTTVYEIMRMTDAYFQKAEKYGVPRDQWLEFADDMYKSSKTMSNGKSNF